LSVAGQVVFKGPFCAQFLWELDTFAGNLESAACRFDPFRFNDDFRFYGRNGG
jgi:hypothetical protein